MRVRRAAVLIVTCFQLVCAQVRCVTHLHMFFTVKPFSRLRLLEKSIIIPHGCVSTVGACVEWTRRSNLRELIVAEGVRQHRRNVSSGTSGTFLVRIIAAICTDFCEALFEAIVNSI